MKKIIYIILGTTILIGLIAGGYLAFQRFYASNTDKPVTREIQPASRTYSKIVILNEPQEISTESASPTLSVTPTPSVSTSPTPFNVVVTLATQSGSQTVTSSPTVQATATTISKAVTKTPTVALPRAGIIETTLIIVAVSLICIGIAFVL